MKNMAKKEIKTVRLKRLEGNLALVMKSKRYVEGELDRVREKEEILRKKIGRQKKAISLVNKAKKLR